MYFLTKVFKDILIYQTYFFFSKIIIFSIYRLKKRNFFVYYNRYGFGDFLYFCVHLRKKINKNKKIFCYSQLQYEIAKFFFDKEKIITAYLLLPKCMSESHLAYNFLLKEKKFIPTEPKRITPDNKIIPISEYYCGTKDSIKFIKKKISKSKISNKIINIFKKPTISIFIKTIPKQKNKNLNLHVRQTRNLNKIEKLINLLIKKKIRVLILGKKKDYFIKLYEKILKEKIKKKIFFFKDLSSNYSISEQAYVALNSKGYIGSATGLNSFFGLLNKKHILIDCVYYFSDKYYKNIFFLYKKILNKKNKTLNKFFWQTHYDPKIYKIIEVNFLEIKKALFKKFKINC